MNVLDVIQHSPEWYKARLGMLTATKLRDAIKERKRGEGDLAGRRKLKLQLLAEMMTGRTADNYVSQAMDWGTEQEPRARAEYEIRTGASVEPIGIVLHPELKWAAASPDGWVAPNGLIEIKAPETATHLEYLERNAIPEEYIDQIDWQLACAGPEIDYVDFISFDPRIEDPEYQMLIFRRERDNKAIAEKEVRAIAFMDELTQLFEQIKRGAKGQTLESKLRESIRDAELRRELASVESGLVP